MMVRKLLVIFFLLLFSLIMISAKKWSKAEIVRWEEAITLVEKGENYKKAADLLEQAINERPQSEPAVRLYGMVYKPYLPYYYLGRARFHLAQYDKALEAFEEELKREAIKHAKCAKELSFLEDLLKKTHAKLATEILADAERYLNARDFKGALSILHEALQRDPSNENISAKISEIKSEWGKEIEGKLKKLRGEQRFDEAIAQLQNLRTDPSPFDSKTIDRLEKDIRNEKQEKIQAQREAEERKKQLRQRQVASQEALAAAQKLLKEDRFKEAIVKLEEAIQLDEKNKAAQNELNRAQRTLKTIDQVDSLLSAPSPTLGDLHVAEEQVKDVEKIFPDSKRVVSLREGVASRIKKINQERSLKKKRKRDSQEAFSAAKKLLTEDSFQEAVAKLKEAIQLDENNEAAQNGLIKVQNSMKVMNQIDSMFSEPSVSLGDLRKAEDQVKGLSVSFPNSNRVANLRTEISAKIKKIVQEQALKAKAKESFNNGMELYKAGRFSEAIIFLQTAFESNPTLSEAQKLISASEKLDPIWASLEQELKVETTDQEGLQHRVGAKIAEIQQIDPSHPGISGFQENLQAKLRDIHLQQMGKADSLYQEAKELVSEKGEDYRTFALEKLHLTLQLNPDHQEALQLTNQLEGEWKEIENELSLARKLMEEGKKSEAKKHIYKVIRNFDHVNEDVYGLLSRLSEPEVKVSPTQVSPLSSIAVYGIIFGSLALALSALFFLLIRRRRVQEFSPLGPGAVSPPPPSTPKVVHLPQPYKRDTVIGNYTIESTIREGRMAFVYKVCHKKKNITCVLKIPSRKRLQDSELLKSSHQEVNLIKRISHSNIVTILDAGTHEDLPYFVMEYVKGHNLRVLLHSKGSGSLDRHLSVEIIHRVCQALNHIHTLKPENLIHKDIKPENIMVELSRGGKLSRLKLIGFGTFQGSRAGQIAGFPPYISPEQSLKKPLDGRSDIFALGVVFYELLTGEVLFIGNTLHEMLENVVKKPVAPPSGLDANLASIVMKMLEKDPNLRYQSAKELDEDLQKMILSLQ